MATQGVNINFGTEYSHWSNEINERNYTSADSIVKKLIRDNTPNTNIQFDKIIYAAACADNSNIHIHKFSPMQLKSHRNNILPGLHNGTIATDASP